MKGLSLTITESSPIWLRVQNIVIGYGEMHLCPRRGWHWLSDRV